MRKIYLFKKHGQIFPFLLVGIVGLLALSLGVAGSFGAAKTRTCAANGADAGALATASRYCYAFNELCLKNKAMRDYYNLDRSYYRIMYDASDAYLVEGLQKSKKCQEYIERLPDSAAPGRGRTEKEGRLI